VSVSLCLDKNGGKRGRRKGAKETEGGQQHDKIKLTSVTPAAVLSPAAVSSPSTTISAPTTVVPVFVCECVLQKH